MSTTVRKVWLLIAISLLPGYPLKTWAQSAVIDQYIKEAFASNEGLKQQSIQLDQALNALKQAKTLYYPNVSLLGSYTRAAGGRTIDLPIGDLMNPVYKTLNTLTNSQNFPSIGNQSILLNPDDFYDTKFRTTLPLINAEIWLNEKLKKETINRNQAAVNVYKRELARDVKEAYYRYYQAQKAVEIYKNSLLLTHENIRVNKSLVKNGVKNNTVVIRAEAEEEKVNAGIIEAENNVKNARLYFNFLLNRPADDSIQTDGSIFNESALANQPSLTEGHEREELVALRSAIAAYGIGYKLQKSYLVPKVNTFLDLGSQGFQFKFNDKTAYYMWGLNLQWDLFAAGQNKYKIKGANYDVQIAASQFDQTQQALQLETNQAINNYKTAYAAHQNATTQLALANRYYNDELKLYKEGSILYIELVDAMNQLTSARLQENIASANILVALANIERKQATYSFK